MRIVIVGPGAFGSLLAARISSGIDKGGHSLSILDYRKDRADFLTKNGLFLEENGHIIHLPLIATADPQSISGCDVLFLCVKSISVVDALQHAAPLLLPGTILIGMQNGISHLATLETTDAHPAAGISSEGALLTEIGRVEHGGSGLTRLGLLNKENQETIRRLHDIAVLLNAGEIRTEAIADIHPHIWAKLFINVGINALTALLNRRNGQLLTSCSVRSTMKMAIGEAVAVAKAEHIEILTDPVEEAFQVCRRTKNNISSMLQDIQRKRPTEIDAINGAIVSLAKKYGIPTPVNEDLVQRIKALEDGWTR